MLKEMTSSAALRSVSFQLPCEEDVLPSAFENKPLCVPRQLAAAAAERGGGVQAWLLEKPAAWADEDAPGCSDGPAASLRHYASGPARTHCLRPSARTSALASRASMRSSSMKCCAAWSGSARTEISACG